MIITTGDILIFLNKFINQQFICKKKILFIKNNNLMTLRLNLFNSVQGIKLLAKADLSLLCLISLSTNW